MTTFNPDCRLCPRLAAHLKDIRKQYPDYHARPVAPFGASKPELLIVGLAPGLHGANASGRPFTGDYAGIILYETLHKFGFSNKPQSLHLNDGLRLKHCRITNAVKCLPPGNKPLGCEITTCNTYLATELDAMASGTAILALGRIAHGAVIKGLALKQKDHAFAHGKVHALPGVRTLVDSYHCSRYNTQTRRLTPDMFHDIFHKIHEILDISK
jgi:uracil-DNA glycosylase family 4